MATYIGILRKNPSRGFGVNFPDFPGCVTGGNTRQRAREVAAEALGFHIEEMIEDGEAIPLPSTLDQVMEDSEHRDGVAILIDTPSTRVSPM